MALLDRSITTAVVEAMTDTPVVVINGARQVGKSTLVRTLTLAPDTEYVSMDDETVRRLAAYDPRGFVERSVSTLVIDEAQLEPRLFRAIKAAVDRDRRPGRFLLTGSSRLLSMPDMADSLVGRVDIVELWPFSQGETLGHHERFVDVLFEDPRQTLSSSTLTRDDYLRAIVTGGFPEAIRRTGRRRSAWFDAYGTTLVQRVVSEIADIERSSELPRLVRLCAARTGTELNVANIAHDFGSNGRTVSSYLTHLANTYIIQLLPAWSTNLSAKVIRRPKLLMVDSGLAAHFMGLNHDSLLRIDAPLGQLFETFVAMEIRKQLSWAETRPTMWHFRDRSGAEVDVLLEHPDGRVVGLEIKATMSVSPSDFKGLRFLADRLGERFVFGAVLSMTPEAVPFGTNMAALPISALWNSRSGNRSLVDANG